MALVAAGQVVAVARDPATGCYTAIELRNGAAFSIYRFKEDRASYTETAEAGQGPVRVVHTLEMELEKVDAAAARAADEMCAASGGGIIAVVTANNGVSVLAGYSDRFAADYPLRLVRGNGWSGLKPTDTSAETVVLQSVDTAKSRQFTGSIPLE